ncbi:MAG: T9SS type A sorting domain-containing protein [Bacteroidales bacterium]|nr:T9SS type A sorting domain-containing protein [Bacteroidales bacterium]
MKILLFIPLCWIYISLSSQVTFNNMYLPNGTNPSGATHIELTDTGYLLTGWAPPGILSLSFIDFNGELLSSKNYSSDISLEPGLGKSNFVKKGDNYFHIGFTESTDRYSSFIIKYNSDLDTLFLKEYFIDSLYSGSHDCIVQDSFLIITGWYAFDDNFEDLLIYKVDLDGNMLWFKNFGGLSQDIGKCIEISYDGGYLIGGKTHSYGSGSPGDNGQWYLIKTDSSGNMQWSKNYGNPDFNDNYINDISKTIDSCYLLCGSYVTGPVSTSEYLKSRLVKFDQSGNIIWGHLYGYNGEYNKISRVLQKTSGDIITISMNDSLGQTGLNFILHCLSDDGRVKWRRDFYFNQYWDSFFSLFDAIRITEDGGFIISGTGTDFNLTPSQYTWAIKTDSLGFDGVQCLEDTSFNAICLNDTICENGSWIYFKVTGLSAPYKLEFSDGTVHDSLFYPFTYEDYIIDSLYFIPEMISMDNTVSIDLTLTDPFGNVLIKEVVLDVKNCGVDVSENSKEVIKIYPNPLNDKLFFEFDSKYERVNVTILDSNSKSISEKHYKIIKKGVINITNYLPGNYFILFELEDSKVIKQVIKI